MHWRDELITSAEQAKDFLCRQLSAIGVSKLYVDINTNSGLSVDIKISKGSYKEKVIDFDISGGHKVAFQGLGVAPYFRGKKLGAMAVKCALGVAYECSTDSITIINVQDDGISFWPTFGAIPNDKPYLIGSYIEVFLKSEKNVLDNSSIKTLQCIRKMSNKSPYRAWRELSKTKIKCEDNRYFKHSVFAAMCFASNLIFPLNHPETRTALKKHVGKIPHFTPSKNIKFQRQPQRQNAYALT